MENEFYIDYSKLDDFQRQLVDKKVNKSMVVTGSAGSGKSVIALHKAKQVSSLGSYAVIVFTKTLKKYFKDGLSKLGLFNVYHYNEWPKNKVKYLIVDECQDFSPDEIDEMRKASEYCFFFGDTDQSIMSFRGPLQKVEETAYKLGISPTPLYFNYRLTKEIASFAEVVGNIEDVAEKCIRNGEKPQLIEKKSIDLQLDEIIRLIQNRSLSNVGILMPFNSRRSANSRMGDEKVSVEYVKDYFSQHGVPNEFKYNANRDTEMDLDFNSSNPKIMTWWCAKGLQFNDVFIPCCNIPFEEDKRSAMYVALTRSSERLHVCYTSKLSSFFPYSDSDLYDNDNEIEII
jgi:superfamily I DNA/RNA helicase